jgi:hypothetical protein
MARLGKHFRFRVIKELYSAIQLSDFGGLLFLFQTRERGRVWFNYTFVDLQLCVA